MPLTLLHTADWHLGRNLEGFNRFAEETAVLEELCTLAEERQAQMVLVAGDIYDTYNPGKAAEHLFFEYLERLAGNRERLVVVIAGNHDQAQRLQAVAGWGSRLGIVVVGEWQGAANPIETPRYRVRALQEPHLLRVDFAQQPECPLYLLPTPFVNLGRLGDALQDEEQLGPFLQRHWQAQLAQIPEPPGERIALLVSHLFAQADTGHQPEESDSERGISLGGAQVVYGAHFPPELDYVALGHLHRPQTLTVGHSTVRYAGSLLAHSLSEKEQEKSVTEVSLTPGQPAELTTHPLQAGYPIRELTAASYQEALELLMANPEYYVHLKIWVKDYLGSGQQRELKAAHPRLLAIEPLLENAYQSPEESLHLEQEDLLEPRKLFPRFYRHSHNGQDPPEEVLQLFEHIYEGGLPDESELAPPRFNEGITRE